jgi:hypothetical protein
MTKQDFITRVLAVINEAGQFTEQDRTQYFGAAEANLDRFIETVFVDAWRRCVNTMQELNWFKNASFKTAEHHPDLLQGTGYVKLPDDFYRLTKFKMQGWIKPVFEAAIANERVAALQTNEYVRGSQIRPVCVIDEEWFEYSATPTLNGVYPVIRYFSLPPALSSHFIEAAIYIPKAEPLTDKPLTFEMELSDQVIEPIVSLTGAGVLTLIGKYDGAAALEKRAIEMYPGLATTRGAQTTVKV